MRSPAHEAVAQVMFWTGLGCFPLTIVLAIGGFRSEKIKDAIISFFFQAIAFTHFLWYANVLGGSLAAWYLYLPYPLIGFVIFIGIWVFIDWHRRKAAQPPPIPKQ